MRDKKQLILFVFAFVMLAFYFLSAIYLGLSAWQSDGFIIRDDSIESLAKTLENDRLVGSDFGNLLIGVLIGGSFAYSTRKRGLGYTYTLFGLTLAGLIIIFLTFWYLNQNIGNVVEAYSQDVADTLTSWLAEKFRESLTFVALLGGIEGQKHIR